MIARKTIFLLCFILLALPMSVFAGDLSSYDYLQNSESTDSSVSDVQGESIPSRAGEASEPSSDAELLPSEDIYQVGQTDTVTAVEGEISDAQYKAYVLAFLLFFSVVLICYFAYKFFNLFF